MPRFITLAAVVFISVLSHSQKAHKAVFVIVDGIPADVIERLDPQALSSIAKKGGYARAYVGGEVNGYTQTPTISAVGYNSLLTGTWANKHNVWDNDITAPNYQYWNIFRLFKAQFPAKKTAVFSTWLDNRTKLVGTAAPNAGNITIDYSFDGMEHDTTRFPHDAKATYIHLIDEAVADTAASAIRNLAPDLSWIYLQYTDDMAHGFGDSPKMDSAVLAMDGQIKRIWDAIRYREKNYNEEWQIFITTDHGRKDDGFHHGGQSPRERATWIVTNAPDLNERFKKQEAAIVDIMPSIARFLDIRITAKQLKEIDGVPLTGTLSATDATASLTGSSITVSWKAISKNGQAKIWMATTNHFSKGDEDEYTLVAEVPIAAGRSSFAVDVSKNPGGFYKIVVELPDYYLNRWIVPVTKDK